MDQCLQLHKPHRYDNVVTETMDFRGAAKYVLAIFCWLTSFSSLAQDYEFEDLGPGAAVAINDRGDTVVMQGTDPDANSNTWAKVVGLDGKTRNLAPALGYPTFAVSSIDGNGVVGGIVNAGGGGGGRYRSARWDSAGFPSIIQGTAGAGGLLSMNENGVAVYSWNDVLTVSNAAGPRPLSSGAQSWMNVAVSNGEQPFVVGSGNIDEAYRPIMFQSPYYQMTRLTGVPISLDSVAYPYAVNATGLVVGTVGMHYAKKLFYPSAEPFSGRSGVWRDNGFFEYLIDPPRVNAALDVNDHNEIVGAAAKYENTVGTNPAFRAFHMRLGGKWRFLDDALSDELRAAGWILHSASAINTNGQIVGAATKNWAPMAFRLTPKKPWPRTDLRLGVAGFDVPIRLGADGQATLSVHNDGAEAVNAVVDLDFLPSIPLFLGTMPAGCDQRNEKRIRCVVNAISPAARRDFVVNFRAKDFGQFDWRAEVLVVNGDDSSLRNNKQIGSLEVLRALATDGTRYQIRDLGVLASPTPQSVRINEAGEVLVSNQGGRGVIHRGMVATPLAESAYISARSLIGTAINDSGWVVGEFRSSPAVWRNSEFDFWTPRSGITDSCKAIDGVGNVWCTSIRGAETLTTTVRDMQGVWTDIPTPAAFFWIEPLAVNASGTAVGNGRRRTGGLSPIGMRVGEPAWVLPLGVAQSGQAQAISENGASVGYISINNEKHAALWRNRTSDVVDLSRFVGVNSTAWGINGKGEVAGSVERSGRSYAFLWQGETGVRLEEMIDNLGGAWQLHSASGINNSGEIVGVGWKDGQFHAYVLIPIARPPILVTGNTVPALSIAGAPSFGDRLVVDGNAMVVGAPWDSELGDNAGAVYVYQRANDRWLLDNKLVEPSGQALRRFGNAIDSSGGLLVVGASSSAYAFRNYGGAKPLPIPSATYGQVSATYGPVHSIGTDGRSIAVASGLWLGVFDQGEGGWTQINLSPPYGSHNQRQTGFSSALEIDSDGLLLSVEKTEQHALYSYDSLSTDRAPTPIGDVKALSRSSMVRDGNRAVLGSPNDNTAYVYRRTNGKWGGEDKLIPPGDIGRSFGEAVAISEDMIAIGAPYDVRATRSTGAVYLYQRHGHAWLLEKRLAPEDAPIGAKFGAAVAFRQLSSGVELIVGAPGWKDADTSKGTGRILTYQLALRLPVVDLGVARVETPAATSINNTAVVPFDLRNESTTVTAYNVVVRCVPPTGQSATLTGSEYTASGSLPEIIVPRLSPGETLRLACGTKIAEAGSYTLAVYVQPGSTEEDPDSTNNAFTTKLTFELPRIDLALEGIRASSPNFVGKEFITSFTVANNHAENGAHDVRVACNAPSLSALTLEDPAGQIVIDGSSGIIRSLPAGARVNLSCRARVDHEAEEVLTLQLTAAATENDTDESNNQSDVAVRVVRPGPVGAELTIPAFGYDKGSTVRVAFNLTGTGYRYTQNPTLEIDGKSDASVRIETGARDGKGTLTLETAHLAGGSHNITLTWTITDEAGDPQTVVKTAALVVRRAVANFQDQTEQEFDEGAYLSLPVSLDLAQGHGRLTDYRWSLRKELEATAQLQGNVDAGSVDISSILEPGDYVLALYAVNEEVTPDDELRFKIREIRNVQPSGGGSDAPPPSNPGNPNLGALDEWLLGSLLLLAAARRLKCGVYFMLARCVTLACLIAPVYAVENPSTFEDLGAGVAIDINSLGDALIEDQEKYFLVPFGENTRIPIEWANFPYLKVNAINDKRQAAVTGYKSSSVNGENYGERYGGLWEFGRGVQQLSDSVSEAHDINDEGVVVGLVYFRDNCCWESVGVWGAANA